MAGDAINLTALNTQGEGKDLVGMGTMENTLHEWLNTETHGLIAGPRLAASLATAVTGRTLAAAFIEESRNAVPDALLEPVRREHPKW